MTTPGKFRRWVRTGGSRVPRTIRSGRRTVARFGARRAEGSVPEHMDAVVRAATSGTVGSALEPELRTRARLVAARHRGAR
ncbi:MAG: hypothetical protein ACKOYM_03425 [Actinomycetes bacterium]